MNLAEIRKKAQKEKGAESAGSQSSPPVEPSPEEEVPEVPTGQGEEAILETLPRDRHEIVPYRQPKTRPEVFDPVAVLMAGRRSATLPRELTPVADREVVDDGDAASKYLCFRVADEEYAVNLMDIKEIIKPRPVTEVPRAPVFVKGIISLRGMIIPILDMRSRLGFSEAVSSGRERFVIVKKGEGFCGLLVDEVFQVVTLARQPVEKPPAVLEGRDREFVSGIGRHEEGICILMDLEKVLDITLL